MAYTFEQVRQQSADPVDFARWLIDQRFIESEPKICRNCHERCSLQCMVISPLVSPLNLLSVLKSVLDGVVWRCRNNRCRRSYSIRENSLFAVSHFSLLQQFKIVCNFVDRVSISACALQIEGQAKHVSAYYQALRLRLCEALQNQPIVFAQGHIFESDEVLVKHVRDEDGGGYVNQWIQSISDRTAGSVKFYVIPNRSSGILCGNILRDVPPGSLLFTDEWASYRQLGQHGYRHHTVNHSAREYSRRQRIGSRTFSVHINTCEGHHRVLRQMLGNKQVRTLQRLASFLREYEYRHSGRSMWDPFKIEH
jgi:hypothetical protein